MCLFSGIRPVLAVRISVLSSVGMWALNVGPLLAEASFHKKRAKLILRAYMAARGP